MIIRVGIQILADHPRLYWNVNCTPGTEWLRLQHPVPTGRIWTAKDDSVTIPGWLGIPGIRHSIGLARWWHFSCDFLWLINVSAFYVMLFVSGQWAKLVPRTWAVFPNSLSVAIQYLSIQFPSHDSWVRFNSLQQLAYFTTVFIAAPLAIVAGLEAIDFVNDFSRLGAGQRGLQGMSRIPRLPHADLINSGWVKERVFNKSLRIGFRTELFRSLKLYGPTDRRLRAHWQQRYGCSCWL